MDIMKVTEQNVRAELKKSIEWGLHRIMYMVVNSQLTAVNNEKQVDTATCDNIGYDVYELYYNGGTIVANKGDFVFAHFGEVENSCMTQFVEYLVEWLIAKGLNAEYVGNDVLVDGYKVCGTCVTRYGRIDYTAVFIGINTNLEHIKAICQKTMNKVPKGLSEYGITTEEVEEMFLDFCVKER